jgi:diguanylate cyclase (GGDEF)-like protein/PAS domain S-box-containing protein
MLVKISPDCSKKDQTVEPPSDFDTPFYKHLLDNLYDAVYFVNKERVITYWNQGAERLTGYTPQEVTGRHCADNILQHVDENGCRLCLHGCALQKTIEDGQPRESEIYLRHKLGHRVPITVRVTPIRDYSGQIIGAVEVFSDCSAKRRAERRVDKLESLAFQDSLTGVANRRYAELKVAQEIDEVRHFGRDVGLLMIDIDHFKSVNDTWGHEAGDLVLRAVSKTIVANFRPNDLVARWGGEEFLVILFDADSTLLAIVAERCRKRLAATDVTHAGSQIQITASVGATLLQSDDSCQSVIRRVDELMYKSKTSGRDRTTFG